MKRSTPCASYRWYVLPFMSALPVKQDGSVDTEKAGKSSGFFLRLGVRAARTGIKLGNRGYWLLDMVRRRANPGDVESLLLDIARTVVSSTHDRTPPSIYFLGDEPPGRPHGRALSARISIRQTSQGSARRL